MSYKVYADLKKRKTKGAPHGFLRLFIPTLMLVTATSCIQEAHADIGMIKNNKETMPPSFPENKLKTAVPVLDIVGRVTDTAGVALSDVSVSIKDSRIGTATNSSGQYSLSGVNENAVLVFSYVGYTSQEIPVDGRSRIDVVMRTVEDSLNAVIINVGYGRQRKEFLTSSVSTVSGAELVKAPVPNISTALKGQLAGLVAIQSSGKPGSDGASLNIRGTGTYTGQTAPLIMVDGIARDTYDDIDPNEVENISILKDAAATSVFGVRGANGVILITTKRGQNSTVPSINFTGQTARSSFTNLPRFVNSYEYATLLNEQALGDYWVKHAKDPDIKTWEDFVRKRDANWRSDGAINFSDNDLRYFQNAHTPTLANGERNPWYDPYFHPDTDWKKMLFRDATSTSQANVNMRGGGKSMRYFVSLGYLNQDGLFRTDYMAYDKDMQFNKKRYNLRGNLDFDVTEDFKIELNLGTQFVTIGGMDNDAYIWEKRILWAFPMSSPGLVNGKYVVPLSANGDDRYNPMYATENSNYWNKTNNSILNSAVIGTYKLDKITKGLQVRVIGSYDSYFASRSYGRYLPLLYDMRPNPNGDPLDPILSQRNELQPPSINADFFLGKWRKMYLEGTINYNRSFGKHTVAGMLLANREKRFDPNLQFQLPAGYQGTTGRLGYNYNGKYLFEYSVTYNGSENFPEGKRYGVFPSYSGSWIITNEKFYQKNDIVSFLKLRGSYGEVGNDRIGGARYLYLPDTWKNNTGYTFGDRNTARYINGVDEAALGNPNVTWEVSKEVNLAMDTRFFKSKLSVTYEYFIRNRSNILSYRGTVPAIVAANLPPYNLGKVRSWGHNFEVRYNENIGEFNFFMNANGAIQRNEIIYRDEAVFPGLEYQASTGRPNGQQLLLTADGLYTSWSQLYAIDGNGNPILAQPVLALKDGKPYTDVNGNPVYVKDLGFGGRALQPGDIRVVDVNGDGLINEKDRVRQGYSTAPIYSYGVTLGFRFKGFDVSALFAGMAGVARGAMNTYHFDKQQALFEVDMYRFSLDRYNSGQEIRFPSPSYDKGASGFGAENAGNTYFLINTSYTRLQNMTIGYTLTKAFMTRLGVKSARIYVNGDNLYTWSKAKIWGDPENLGNQGYPLYKTYNMGINLNF